MNKSGKNLQVRPQRLRGESFRILSVFSVTLWLCLLLLSISCSNNLDLLADKAFPGEGLLMDQGYVDFDDTGNIKVTINNLEFKSNPMYTEASFIAVWVFNVGADPFARCCSGSTCSTVESKSCIQGFGFSHDLGFAGTYYLERHPPRPFNKLADKYYMKVYVADSTGTPQNYQGEYQTFSSTTNAVGDRQMFDLYVGVFYSFYDPRYNDNRVISSTASKAGNTFYRAVDPDWLSPPIRIESRFYPESPQDPAGSWFPVPHMLTWTHMNGAPRFGDYRNKVLLNEVFFDPTGTDGGANSPELIEIYNTTAETIDIRGWQISSASISVSNNPSPFTANSSVIIGYTPGTTSLTTLPPGGYLTIARFNSEANRDAAPVQYADDQDFSDGKALVRIVSTGGISDTSSARLYQDDGQTIIDYIEWTTNATNVNCGGQSGASPAQYAGIWQKGSCITNITGNPVGIKRIPNGTDTNQPTDFQQTATFTLGGPNS